MDTLLLLQLIQYQEQSSLAFLLLVKSQGECETLDLGGGGAHEVLSDARTSKSCNARRILGKDQHSCHYALPTGRRHPRGSVIPQ